MGKLNQTQITINELTSLIEGVVIGKLTNLEESCVIVRGRELQRSIRGR